VQPEEKTFMLDESPYECESSVEAKEMPEMPEMQEIRGIEE
jgi:hypothetical protein